MKTKGWKFGVCTKDDKELHQLSGWLEGAFEDVEGIEIHGFSPDELEEQSKSCRYIFLAQDVDPPQSVISDPHTLWIRIASEYENPAQLRPLDDLVVCPEKFIARKQDLLGRLAIFEKHLELKTVSEQIFKSIGDFESDLQFATKLQKSKLPVRFPSSKGIKFFHRYLAGMASGGDHFDLAESKDGQTLTLFMMNTNRHGLAAATLSALAQLGVRLSANQITSPSHVATELCQELSKWMNPKDKISLFYATLSRKDLTLKYVARGDVSIRVGQAEHWTQLYGPGEKPAIAIASDGSTSVTRFDERTFLLAPGDRLSILSSGFTQAGERVQKLTSEADPQDYLNDLVYQIKKSIAETDDDLGMPERDCSALVMEVDKNRVRRVV